jgi:ClpP class serine protease
LINTPLAISEEKLEVITSNVSLKLLVGAEVGNGGLVQAPTRRILRDNKVAVIDVFDALASKIAAGASGGTTYSTITRDITSYIEAGAKTLYFYIDSPGGEVAGLFGLAFFIASLPTKYGISTIAFTDGYMCSAAYVLGTACQQVYAVESATVGSVGVIATLVNMVEADKQDGLTYTIIRSKDAKALLNSHETFPEEAINNLTAQIGVLDAIMNRAVIAGRNKKVTQETLDSLAGRTILAVEAKALGLIDDVVSSIDEVLSLSISKQTQSTKGNTMSLMSLEDALVQLNSAQTELATLKASNTLELSKAKTDERERIVGILEAADTFKIPIASAMKFIKASTTTEVAVMSFESIKEAMQTANHVDTSTTGLTPSQIEEQQPTSAKDFFLKMAAAATTENDAIRSML